MANRSLLTSLTPQKEQPTTIRDQANTGKSLENRDKAKALPWTTKTNTLH